MDLFFIMSLKNVLMPMNALKTAQANVDLLNAKTLLDPFLVYVLLAILTMATCKSVSNLHQAVEKLGVLLDATPLDLQDSTANVRKGIKLSPGRKDKCLIALL